MNQDNIDGYKAYAYLYIDLWRILGDCYLNPTPDHIKGLEARFEALNGIVEAIKADPDKEGIKGQIWDITGVNWPGLLRLSGEDVKKRERAMHRHPREEIVERVEDFKRVLAGVNGLTMQIARRLGLFMGIDPEEAKAFFKRDFTKKKEFKKIVRELEAFVRRGPQKKEVAVLAFYLEGQTAANFHSGQYSHAKWLNDFYHLCWIDGDCNYKFNWYDKFMKKHPETYNRIIEPFRAILEIPKDA